MALDAEARVAGLASGRRVRYDALVCTAPLDATLRLLGRGAWADALTHSSAHIIGLGIRGRCPHGSKCWLYFPEPDCPFYRATVFSHYAPANCPPPEAPLRTLCLGDGRGAPAGAAAEPGPYWSLMFEVSESALKPVAQELTPLGGGLWPAVVAETLAGAVATRMLAADDQVVSIYHRRAPT